MYKVTVLYGAPDDPAAFDRYYRETHIPLASRMQGLERWTLTWTADQDGDLSPAIHLVAELYASDRESMMSILDSAEGQAAQEDVANFASGGATFLFGNEEEVELA